MNDSTDKFFLEKKESSIHGLDEFDLDNTEELSKLSTAAAREYLPYEQANKLLILPLEINAGTNGDFLHAAVPVGQEEASRLALRFQTGFDVTVTPFPKEQLAQQIFVAYKGDSKVLNFLPAIDNEVLEFESKDTILSAYDKGKGDAAKGLAALVDYAIAKGISDIHITPLLHGVKIRARSNGALLEREELVGDHKFHCELVNRVKVLIAAPVQPVTIPVDGSFTAGSKDLPVRVRASLMSSLHGDNIVLRLLDNSSISLLADLGYESSLVARLKKVVMEKSGMLLLCGSTGSGKTTTLYSIVQHLSANNRLVHTLEEPIEKTIESIVQTEVDSRRGLSYERCLPALLRQDPDCIMLGELRDKLSAQSIVQAALTGHFTLSSVHGSSIAAVFQRFNHFEIDFSTLIEALSGIICQRLVPTLCSSCKVTDLAGSKTLGVKVYKCVGCAACDYTGYRGRQPVVEAYFPDKSIVTTSKFSIDFLTNTGRYSSQTEGLERLLKAGSIDVKTFKQ